MASRIIAITGASGSGKTHLTDGLRDSLQDQHSIAVIREDCYYRDQTHLEMAARIETNYDHPASLEHELLAQHLEKLKAGNPVQVPDYDYSIHNRTQQSTSVKPVDVILVEGILLLSNPTLRQHFDLTLFVETPLEVCFDRRLARDISERGRTEESVKQQFETTVKPMFHEFIEPSAGYAKIRISGDQDLSVMIDTVQPPIRTLILNEKQS